MARGAAVARIGREAHLVVGDEVQRAADRVPRQALQVERLRHDTLAGEGRVAVNLDRQGTLGIVHRARRLLPVGLQCARAADHDGVDELEMRRVRQEREAHLARDAGLDLELAYAVGAVVVLDVAGASGGHQRLDVRIGLALELGEDLRVGKAEHVRLHVEAATMSHTERDVLNAVARREQDGLVEHQDHRVETLDRELLGAEERALQERLKAFDAEQAHELAALLLGRALDPERARLDRLAQPGALAVRADVLDLVGDWAAVDLGQVFEDGLEGVAFDEGAQRCGRHGLERVVIEFEERRVERGVAGRLGAERIELRGEVAMRAIRLDHRHAGAHVGEQFLGRDVLRQRANRLGALDVRTPCPRRLRGGLAVLVRGLLGRCRHVCDTPSKP